MGGPIGKYHTRPCVLILFDTASRLMVELHDEAGRLVARSLVQYEFIVIANGNRDRQQAHTSERQQDLRPGLNLPSVTASEPMALVSPQRPQPNSSHMDPALRRLSPADGPTSGGPIIAILGINFPPPTQQLVYAKFGTVAVPTV